MSDRGTVEIGCPSIERLEMFLDGNEDCVVSDHLGGCKTCQQRAESIRESDAFLDQHRGMFASVVSASETQGLDVPGYRVISQIDAGGQGVVYKAVQTATKRTVALKLLTNSIYSTPRHRRRFEREIELVAGLRHPNIVTIFDSGQCADGRPFYAMEYIEGDTLDKHISDDSGVSSRANLDLFAKICAGVRHAHQNGIVHRDLKPANILVETSGEPRILDFGLAKMRGTDLPVSKDLSLPGEFAGTFAYASPEQVGHRSEALDSGGTGKVDVDVRSDVYSLGVILFELLTGERPYETGSSVAEAVANIIHAEPGRPSDIRKELDDEIDTIVLKALAKEPERRYQSAGELLSDIQRYLGGEPIEAKRDSTWYILRKTARRQWRILLMTGVAAFVLLMGGLVTATYLVLSARADAARAQVIAQSARAQAASLVLYSASLPRNRNAGAEQSFRGRDLNRLEQQIKLGWLAGDRDRESAAAALLATIFVKGDGPYGAEALIRQANMKRGMSGKLPANEAAEGYSDLAEILLARSRLREAKEYCELALNIRKSRDDDRLAVARDIELLARITLRLGDKDEALKLAHKSARMTAEMVNSDNEDVARSLDTCSMAWLAKGNFFEAHELCLASIRMRLTVLSDEDTAITQSLRHLASIYEMPTADSQSRFLVELYGEDNARGVAVQLRNLAAELDDLALDSVDDARVNAALNHILKIKEAMLGRDHCGLLSTLGTMIAEARQREDFASELSILDRASCVIERNFGINSQPFANLLEEKAEAFENLGAYDSSIEALKQAIFIWYSLPKENRDSFTAVVCERTLALRLLVAARYQEAAERFQHCHAVIVSMHGSDHIIAPYASAGQALSLAILGKREGLEHQVRDALETANRLGQTLPSGQRTFITFCAGSVLARVGKLEEARRLLNLAWNGDSQNQAVKERTRSDRFWQLVSSEMLDVLRKIGDPDLSAKWQKDLDAHK